MKNAKKGSIFSLSAILLSSLISGCGDGGSAANSVNVEKPTTENIVANTVTETPMAGVQLTGVISGDVENLQGKPSYVVLEDPDALFLPHAVLELKKSAEGYRYSINLQGNTLSNPGHFKGNIKVFACLDAKCAEPLRGTPLVIPYDVRVQAGIMVNYDEIEVTAPFGTLPKPVMLDVGWSSFGAGWWFEPLHWVFFDPYKYVVLPEFYEKHKVPMPVSFNPANPGTHVEKIRVRTEANLPDGTLKDFKREITVRYTVTPGDTVDHIFWPPVHEIEKENTGFPGFYPFELLLNKGVAAQLLGVEYLSAAGTSGPWKSWWSPSPANYRIDTCVIDYQEWPSDCLQPGVYTARLKYRLTSPGGTREIAFPLSLTVTP